MNYNFREETQKDLGQIAKILGYASLNDMMISYEFSDIIEFELSQNALGVSHSNKEKVLSFKVML